MANIAFRKGRRCESLIYSLANAQPERIATFLPQERRLVQELIEHFAESPGAEAYAAPIRYARAGWAGSG